jgi:hypothetical protein
MKRMESLDSKLGGSQFTSKINREEKMVVTIFGKRKIIFSEMDKF